ncbi:PAS domain S-box protein [uncultured Mycobacterium sp.]|uniref:PAS domain S-box protein n=1 Tax=uncultured Mycobacterium sp. TaxID=171292 RepID=UPI0035C9DA2A
MPVPSLAMARDGVILFANTAFAEMMGYRQESLAGLALPQVSRTALETLYALSDVYAPPNMVELQHHEGWTVRAKMSKSALMRSDDPVLLVTFENLTERLWMDRTIVR